MYQALESSCVVMIDAAVSMGSLNALADEKMNDAQKKESGYSLQRSPNPMGVVG